MHKKPYSFLTIDTTIKITVADQLKIIDNKIKVNQVQHDLDRLAAKISA